MNKWVHITFTVLGSLSFISGIVILSTYYFTKSLQRNPGMLIFWHIFSQAGSDFFIALTGWYFLSKGEFENSVCEQIGIFATFFYFLGFNYCICLCIEVLLKIQSPMDLTYRKRSKAYHIACPLVAVSISLIICLTNAAGKSVNILCFIKYSENYVYILIIPLIAYIPALLLSIYIACRLYKGKSLIDYFLIKHSVYISVYFFI